MTRVNLHTAAMAEAERAVVAACLTFGSMEEIDLEPKHFCGPKWRTAWTVMLRLQDQGEAIDPILVADLMRSEGLGDVSPHELIDGGESIGAAAPLAIRLRDAYMSREVAMAASEILTAIQDGVTGTEALDMGLQCLSAIDLGTSDDAKTAGDLVRTRYAQLVDIVDAKARGENVATGILSRIEPLDRKLGGLQRGIITVAAGRPGMGKSAFAMSVVDGANKSVGCHVFSLEDTREAYSDRLLARASGISAEKLRICDMTPQEMYEVQAAGSEIARRTGWLVDDSSGLTAEEIVRKVRRNRKQNGTELVVVDYIQLISYSHGIRDKHLALDHAMLTFANAAKSDRMSYLVLSQLNRDCEKRENKRPILADLKASGGIEEQAKTVIFLYRPAEYETNAPEDQIELIVRKNNHGTTGVAIAGWDGPTTRVY